MPELIKLKIIYIKEILLLTLSQGTSCWLKGWKVFIHEVYRRELELKSFSEEHWPGIKPCIYE